jgi:hypothetical protein
VKVENIDSFGLDEHDYYDPDNLPFNDKTKEFIDSKGNIFNGCFLKEMFTGKIT